MLRERSEVITYSRDDIERIVCNAAVHRIVGDMLIGKIGEQSVRWTGDGGVEVITQYTEGSLHDLPPTAPVMEIAPSKKKRK